MGFDSPATDKRLSHRAAHLHVQQPIAVNMAKLPPVPGESDSPELVPTQSHAW